MDALQHIRRLFAYNAWANRRTFDSLESSRGDVSKALRAFTHLLMAEREWLLRLEENRDTTGFDFWPELSLADCGALMGENDMLTHVATANSIAATREMPANKRPGAAGLMAGVTPLR